jgi:HSP20 family protein
MRGRRRRERLVAMAEVRRVEDAMKAMVPERGLGNIRKEMDRLFERLWEPNGFEVTTMAGDWTPNLEISETPERVVARAEIPGIEPKNIQVTLEGQLLTIRGEKNREKEEKDERFYRMERSYGAFARTIRLPAPVDPARVKARFHNGVLTVEMTKAPVETGNIIPVTVE